MSRFRIGQKVVCIKGGGKATFANYPNKVIKGKIYTVKSIKKGCCSTVLDVGIAPYSDSFNMECSCGGTFPCNGVLWCSEIRFAPLQEDGSSLSLTMEIDIHTLEELELETMELS